MTFTMTEPTQGILLIATQGPGNGIQLGNDLQMTGHLLNLQYRATATSAAGVNATVTSFSGSDVAGRCFWQTQTASAGPEVLVIFGAAYPSTPFVHITPLTPTIAAAFGWVTASVNGFTYSVTTIPNSTASHAFHYLVSA